jgi:hypothetical protein
MKKLLVSLSYFTPSLAFAARSFSELIYDTIDLIGAATTLLVGAAMVFFFYNAATSMWAAKSGDTGGQEKLREVLLWGIIIVFVMASVWGIIAILKQTLLGGGTW